MYMEDYHYIHMANKQRSSCIPFMIHIIHSRVLAHNATYVNTDSDIDKITIYVHKSNRVHVLTRASLISASCFMASPASHNANPVCVCERTK